MATAKNTPKYNNFQPLQEPYHEFRRQRARRHPGCIAGYNPLSTAVVSQLTKREFDILELLEKGKTSKEIGVQLNMSYRTVEVHRYHLLKKVDCKRTTELLRKMSAWAAH